MIKKLLLFALIPFIFCGCTNNTDEKIIFSSWGSVSEVKILKQVISEFEKDNPDIKIKFIHIPQNYFQKIHLLFASNTEPDVIFINNLNIPVYEKYLEDLSQEINPNDFYQQSLDGLSYNNKILAVPRDISTLVFYINLSLIPEPASNWNMDDFLNLAQEASKKGAYGVSFEEEIYWALPYLWYFNGGVLDKNLNLITHTKETQQGLDFYLDLRDKYKVAPCKNQIGSSTLGQMFLDGKIAMYLSGRWMYPKVCEKADFKWSIKKFPTKTSIPCDSSGWAISKNSKHKESAKKFVKYLASEKSSEYFAQTGLIIPARIQVAKKLDNGKEFIESIEFSETTPVNKDYRKIVDNFEQELGW